ncbi:15722_t:CDS:1, partial [Dentiscutata heterogama]
TEVLVCFKSEFILKEPMMCLQIAFANIFLFDPKVFQDSRKL